MLNGLSNLVQQSAPTHISSLPSVAIETSSSSNEGGFNNEVYPISPATPNNLLLEEMRMESTREKSLMTLQQQMFLIEFSTDLQSIDVERSFNYNDKHYLRALKDRPVELELSQSADQQIIHQLQVDIITFQNTSMLQDPRVQSSGILATFDDQTLQRINVPLALASATLNGGEIAVHQSETVGSPSSVSTVANPYQRLQHPPSISCSESRRLRRVFYRENNYTERDRASRERQRQYLEAERLHAAREEQDRLDEEMAIQTASNISSNNNTSSVMVSNTQQSSNEDGGTSDNNGGNNNDDNNSNMSSNTNSNNGGDNNRNNKRSRDDSPPPSSSSSSSSSTSSSSSSESSSSDSSDSYHQKRRRRRKRSRGKRRRDRSPSGGSVPRHLRKQPPETIKAAQNNSSRVDDSVSSMGQHTNEVGEYDL